MTNYTQYIGIKYDAEWKAYLVGLFDRDGMFHQVPMTVGISVKKNAEREAVSLAVDTAKYVDISKVSAVEAMNAIQRVMTESVRISPKKNE